MYNAIQGPEIVSPMRYKVVCVNRLHQPLCRRQAHPMGSRQRDEKCDFLSRSDVKTKLSSLFSIKSIVPWSQIITIRYLQRIEDFCFSPLYDSSSFSCIQTPQHIRPKHIHHTFRFQQGIQHIETDCRPHPFPYTKEIYKELHTHRTFCSSTPLHLLRISLRFAAK